MKALLKEMGDPQNTYPTVHVGGTAGKGSVSTMVCQNYGKRGLQDRAPHITAPPGHKGADAGKWKASEGQRSSLTW